MKTCTPKLRSAATGISFEVDHVVPLVSPYVCGLHNAFNLAVIPAIVNRSKGNRWWPGMSSQQTEPKETP